MAKRTAKQLPPMHPGEVFREEYLEQLGLSAGAVAKACGLPRTRLERLAKEETGISADTALRLAKVFNTTPNFWLNLQIRYELLTTEVELEAELADIEPVTEGSIAA